MNRTRGLDRGRSRRRQRVLADAASVLADFLEGEFGPDRRRHARRLSHRNGERSGDGNLLERPCLHVVTSQPLCLLHQHHAAWRRGQTGPVHRVRGVGTQLPQSASPTAPAILAPSARDSDATPGRPVAARFTARSVRVAVGNSTSALSAPLSARRTPGQSGGCSCHCERSEAISIPQSTAMRFAASRCS